MYLEPRRRWSLAVSSLEEQFWRMCPARQRGYFCCCIVEFVDVSLCCVLCVVCCCRSWSRQPVSWSLAINSLEEQYWCVCSARQRGCYRCFCCILLLCCWMKTASLIMLLVLLQANLRSWCPVGVKFKIKVWVTLPVFGQFCLNGFTFVKLKWLFLRMKLEEQRWCDVPGSTTVLDPSEKRGDWEMRRWRSCWVCIVAIFVLLCCSTEMSELVLLYDVWIIHSWCWRSNLM